LRQHKTTDSLTVEITATISINKDGTWRILNFGKEQKVIDEKQTTLGEAREPFWYREEIDEEPEPEFKPASWYLENAKKTRKRRKYNRGPNHCGRCGMVNKNKLTCLSVMRADGTFESQKHREAEYPFGRWI